MKVLLSHANCDANHGSINFSMSPELLRLLDAQYSALQAHPNLTFLCLHQFLAYKNDVSSEAVDRNQQLKTEINHIRLPTIRDLPVEILSKVFYSSEMRRHTVYEDNPAPLRTGAEGNYSTISLQTAVWWSQKHAVSSKKSCQASNTLTDWRSFTVKNVLLDDDLNVKIGDFGLSNEISDGDFHTRAVGVETMLPGSYPRRSFPGLLTLIKEGNFHLPSYLSSEAKDLITLMLVVDPLKRITVPEIIKHPFFTTNLPRSRYLTPLPPPPGPVLGTLSALVGPPKQLDFEMIDGLGKIEEDVVEKLAELMDGVTVDAVWACLRMNDGAQGNAV
ncbi:hypothetical protein D9613_004447 [Agrocybe pediades]|uniref:Protein kinase domain-containing protein n=1 Tax=Agrocybe pediades TaxID=84607 RepID=A0A8H4QJ00_9AGAR|nr:hypothetical protein D9613_004447 [Agrocybe pediades]